jgi:hypothetical protein
VAEEFVITVGLAICVLAGLSMLVLLLRPQGFHLEAAFIRLSWLPPAALLAQGFLWPFLKRLSYAAILPPLLTCVASLFLGVMGATLVAAGAQRGESDRRLLRATFVASSPGMLLLGYMIYAYLMAIIRMTPA